MIIPKHLQHFVQNRWLFHLLFWAFSFYVLAKLFAYDSTITTVDWIYTMLFHLSIWMAVYPNLLWLIPRFLQTGKILLYVLLMAVVILLAVGFNFLTFNFLSDLIFPGYYFIAYYGFWEIVQFIAVYVVVTSLLKLSKGWFKYLEAQRQFDRLHREKLDAELSALKSQVNPHFLFNSLNNLYSLALDQDKRTPAIILRLSDMMRYLLYESNVPTVPLSKELEHLQNYVEMQRLRVGDQADIRFEIKGSAAGKEVAPLLFLPLVENGFKHGIKGETKGAFIFMHLKIEDNQVVFKIENNKGIVDEVENRPTKGVGLQNLRRRLELIHQGQYELEVTDGIKRFMVILKVPLSNIVEASNANKTDKTISL
ncbi:MAG TPA: histidine kinase [Saprospiraceae bacterium]|nr:histidine kinase [Saprospiraceae bacterium]HMQ83069.1 histidine kinase [Saprospiraceae bacterium]